MKRKPKRKAGPVEGILQKALLDGVNWIVLAQRGRDYSLAAAILARYTSFPKAYGRAIAEARRRRV